MGMKNKTVQQIFKKSPPKPPDQKNIKPDIPKKAVGPEYCNKLKN